MAETVHLFLKGNGFDIQGESTQTSIGRENSIECLSFKSSVLTVREKGTAIATGRRQHEPIVIHKRIDKSSPLLIKALCDNQVIEAEFKFYRPNPTGDGTTEQFYTIAFRRGRVSQIELISPDVIAPASTNAPPTEQVSFVFHTISWTYANGGVTHEDTWDQQK
jgi:type VI secretion system secreted protein Hcp